MKQIKWVTGISSVLIAGALAGCMSQNPYPADGILTPTPAIHHPVAPVYVIGVPDTILFQEGKLSTFGIVTLVPSGTPVVTVQGLPDGATFDSVKNLFTWTPDFNAGHDPANPTIFEKDYNVEFYLSSSDDPLTVVSKVVQVRVKGVAMPLDILTDGTPLDVKEGDTLSVAFTVKSPDFPQGPFALQFTNLPEGAVVTPSAQDPSLYNLTYAPGFDAVLAGSDSNTDANGYVKTIYITATATGPRAQKIQKSWDLVIHDVRQAPSISAPDDLTFGYAADISFVTVDLNNETPPSVTIDKPPFGSLNNDPQTGLPSCTPVAAVSTSNPYELCHILWTGIPATEFNRPQSLTIHSCGVADMSGVQPCTTQTVNMEFVGRQHLAPSFDRTLWGPAEVKYIRLGTTLSVAMKVTDTDADPSAPPPAVMVGPIGIQSEVIYSKGVLTVTPASTGTRVFELISDSVFGVEGSESFTMRVLPKDWGSVILLGQSKTDSEAQAMLPILDAQLINPFFETVDDDALVLRKSAFMTTSSINSGLSTGDLGALLGKTENVLGHVVVSTPLTAKLPRPALPDDLTLGGRFSTLTLPGKPSLNAMSIVPVVGSSVFVGSKKPVKLNQSLTVESTNPMTFVVKPGGACSVVMNLTNGTLQIPVAVECTLSSGNKVLFVGFEWGDMAFDATDAGLGQTWLTSWLATAPNQRSAR